MIKKTIFIFIAFFYALFFMGSIANAVSFHESREGIVSDSEQRNNVVPYTRESGSVTYQNRKGAALYNRIMCESRFANQCYTEVCLTSGRRDCTTVCRVLARDKCKVAS